MKAFLKNLEALILSSVLSAIVSFLLNRYTPLTAVNWYYGIIFLCTLCFVLNLIYTYQAGSKTFTELLFGSLVIKLLLALAGIVVYLSVDKEGFRGFALQFVIHYVLFTIFEIRYLLYLIKSQTTKNN